MKISETTLSQLLDNNKNISDNERLAIKEILKSSKVKTSNRNRYSDKWVILCILLHMRSPVTYRMIRDNKILPLPDTRTIRRYNIK